MSHVRRSVIVLTAAALLMPFASAQAFDDTLYSAFTGQWTRFVVPGAVGFPPFDPKKPPAQKQEAPLTREYQARFETTLAERAERGLSDVVSETCLAPGMPMMMQAYEPMQITVLPETTYILIDHIHDSHRRIFTDGRDWPTLVELPTFAGYSIGRWIDEDADGRYNVLEAETRYLRGPRVFDSSGIPLHQDNATIIKERLYLDKADQNLLHDEITVIDHALTRPWMVTKTYRRNLDPLAVWPEYLCPEQNPFIRIQNEYYHVNEDGYLTPTKKGQAPPDLRYFTR
jgi:hypothetical protein